MITMTRRGLLANASAGVLLAAGGLPARAQGLSFDDGPITATIAGYSARGMVSVLGEGQAAVVREAFKGSNVVYEPGNPAGSFVAVANGEREFALESTIEMNLAKAGAAPFPESFDGKFWLVTTLSPNLNLVHFYGRRAVIEEHGIGSLADIRDKKLKVNFGINQPGNLWGRVHIDAIFAAYGMKKEDIVALGGSLIEQNTAGTMDLMRQGRADFEITGGFVPVGSMAELNNTTPVGFVPMSQEVVKQVADKLGGGVGVIKAGDYEWVKEDLYTPSSSHFIIAGPAATDEQVWKFCKAMDTKLDVYHAMHPALVGLTRQNLVPAVPGIPLHPAAEAYYKSRSL